MTLTDLGLDVYRNAQNHGFYEEINELMMHPNLTDKQKHFIRYLWRANRLMLIVSELAEGLEGLRHSNISASPGSGGLGEELADVQIRLSDFAVDIGLNLRQAVIDKHDFNKNRPYKHGGKIA